MSQEEESEYKRIVSILTTACERSMAIILHEVSGIDGVLAKYADAIPTDEITHIQARLLRLRESVVKGTKSLKQREIAALKMVRTGRLSPEEILGVHSSLSEYLGRTMDEVFGELRNISDHIFDYAIAWEMRRQEKNTH